MKGYAQLRSRFWTHGTGKALRGDPKSQLVALYLISAPQADMSGIYHMPVMYIAHETGLTEADVLRGIERLQAEGFLVYDLDNEDVWVCSMAKEQIGDSLAAGDKRRKAIEKQLQAFERSRLLPLWLERYGEQYSVEVDACPIEAPPKPLPTTLDAPSKGHSAVAAAVVDAVAAAEQPAKATNRRPPAKPGEPSAHQRYAEAYAAGMSDVTGEPFAPPRGKRDLVDMALLAIVDGQRLGGDELLTWIRQTAAAYRRARAGAEQFESGFSVERCVKWLNAGRPTAAQGARPVQPVHGEQRAWDAPDF